MKSKRRSKPLAVFLVVLLAVLIIENIGADEFTWTAKRQWSRLSEGRELTVLSGGAVITSGATRIVADEIELWGTDFRYAMAQGAVTATDDERGIILKSESLFYDREEEIIRVDGFIDMQDLKNDVVARGSFFEFFGKDEIAYIQIGVRILKVDEDTELACRSEFARYLRDDEVLELSGMPHVTRNNDVYTAARITINLDTDEILLDRDVSGRLVTKSDEESADQTTGAATEAEEPPVGEATDETTGTAEETTAAGAESGAEAGEPPVEGNPERSAEGGGAGESANGEGQADGIEGGAGESAPADESAAEESGQTDVPN